MRDRAEQILRIVCLVLAGLLLYQLARTLVRSNPLARVNIPQVPSLPAGTNAPPVTTARSTNALAAPRPSGKDTNAPAAGLAKGSTNSTATAKTDPGSNSIAASSPGKASTNFVPDLAAAGGAATGATVRPAPGLQPIKATNASAPAGSFKGTNVTRAAEHGPGGPDTNAAALAAARARAATRAGPEGAMMAMNPSQPGRIGPAPELPPAIKARVYRVYDSEILGQVMRPLPMALLGIAGNTAFLRASTGQTGLAKEGEKVGDLKLLRIGVNRVLVEVEGEQKELMIFNGYGGESLLSKPQENSK